MEGVGVNPKFWQDRNVFITGHTGFKGSWLTTWLKQLGANVTGLSLRDRPQPNLFEDASVGDGIHSLIGDVRNYKQLLAGMSDARPDIVIHLAAQSIVRRSYEMPTDTYSTNVMGTVNILEAIRHTESVRAALIVTSDKCYENRETDHSYQESDALGGHDPYSSSKGCAELVTASYRSSYFSDCTQSAAVASARAGNVVAGGDWAEDRLVPDIVSALHESRGLELRNPHAVRPWQFVLDALHGYLMLAEHLCEDGPEFSEAWNFGPPAQEMTSVGELAERAARSWGNAELPIKQQKAGLHEAQLLKLDSSKARDRLGWQPLLTLDETLAWIVDWYRCHFDGGNVADITSEQVKRFGLMAAK